MKKNYTEPEMMITRFEYSDLMDNTTINASTPLHTEEDEFGDM